jgi:CRISPR-associated protein Csx10
VPEVIVTARQGLAVGGPAEVGFDKGTLPYVPGSTVRGALAAAWIRQNGTPVAANKLRDEFVELFEGDICYGPLLQDGTSVTPLTATWCKYPSTPACGQWSADAAVDGDIIVCPHCGKGTENGKGEVAGARTRRVMRTRLDSSGRAADGNLFARHELEPGLTYRGVLSGQHPWLAEPQEIWLGGRTTTSGLASIRIDDEPPASPDPVPAGSPRPDGAVIIKLTSPAVIVDDAGRPTLDPASEILRVLGMKTAALHASRCWTRPVRVGGWHAASGLPKPVELAMSMGSVIVLHFREDPTQDQLQHLACHGIGLRRVEGFGTAGINPPPWQRPATPTARTAEQAGPVVPSALAALRDLALLQDETTVRWLLDRCRLVLVERERDPRFAAGPLLAERVAVYFDDAQADAVRALFASGQLRAAIPILEQTLEQITNQQAASSGTASGDQR